MDYLSEATKKLNTELKSGKFDKYGGAMKAAVCNALISFCEQDEEFAQAVAQGGSFSDCMTAVGKCVKGGSISDMEAYGAAVKFYFPGAEIKVKMSIDLCASVKTEPEAPAAGNVIIDLSSFF